jgi:serine/threonine-protein phosphatase 2A regulatory subunit B'
LQVEKVLVLSTPEHFSKFMLPLFAQVGSSIGSAHFQVAQRALNLWNNEYVVSLVAQERLQVLPIIFLPLYQTCKQHWHSEVRSMAYNVLKLFMEMDLALFNAVSATVSYSPTAVLSSSAPR